MSTTATDSFDWFSTLENPRRLFRDKFAQPLRVSFSSIDQREIARLSEAGTARPKRDRVDVAYSQVRL